MINIPKGTKDVLPQDSYKWQYVEKIARNVARSFGFNEIRTPTFESTELFARGVGDTTDVVTKEMYTFEDKGGRSMTLKPEGTAGVARSFIENGLASTPMPLKAYYIAPCYRYERPQAGRLREFHQFGVEMFGSAEPSADAEIIFAASSFLKKLGIKDTRLEINSIGCKTCRAEYNEALKQYFRSHLNEMCPDCNSRFEKNPLRILDCKVEGCKKIASGAPKILDYLCPDCRAHFEKVKNLLDVLKVQYVVNPDIVRGLDYYTRTVFEFVSQDIGAQGTVLGGGRYDALISELGGGNVPAIGFAAGIERLLLVMENTGVKIKNRAPDIYVIGMDDASRIKAFEIANRLRSASDYIVDCDHLGRSFKSQLKYASKIGVRYIAVIGEDELYSGTVKLKNMKKGEEQVIPVPEILENIKIVNRGKKIL